MSLFQTSAWQGAWWDVWGTTPGFQVVVAGGEGQSGLYLDQYLLRGVLPIRCLQFIGTNYRRVSTPRTEYNGINPAWFTGDDSKSVLDLPWSEAVFRDLIDNTAEIDEIKRLCSKKGWSLRIVHEDWAYQISTSVAFSSYLKSLGSNTRLRLFNRRKLLESCGTVERKNLWPANPDGFFELLNEFHEARWGTPCFGAQSLAFHKQFLKNIVDGGGAPELSVIYCDQKAISVLYNVAFEGVVYNLQSGFLEAFHRKLALGTLHLGYSIEDACLSPDIRAFDLLAGGGKNEDYKKRLANIVTPLVSVMIVRSRFLKLLYRLKP